MVKSVRRLLYGAVVRFHAQVWTPFRLRMIYKFFGLTAATDAIGRLPMQEVPAALRLFGARVGERAWIKPGLRIENAREDLSNLTIGDNVHIGSDVVLDLSGPIVLEDDSSLAARAILLTHLDFGDRPNQAAYPRRVAEVRLCRGSGVGANTVVLHGVTIGENAIVGAESLVYRDVPPEWVVGAVPARRMVATAAAARAPDGP